MWSCPMHSHLPKLDQRKTNYSTNVYHGLGFANKPGDEEYSAAIIKLKDLFESVLQTHPSAVIGYPPKIIMPKIYWILLEYLA